MASDKLGPGLAARMTADAPAALYDINIFIKDAPAKAPIAESAADFTERTYSRASTIRSRQTECSSVQRDVIDYLSQQAEQPPNVFDSEVRVPRVLRAESFWINNSVAAEVSADVLDALLTRDDVFHVEIAHYAPIDELIDAGDRRNTVPERTAAPGTLFRRVFANVTDAPSPPAWSVTRINAPLLWQIGINGDGVLVAVVDTGVNYGHPDLQNRMWNGGPQYPHHGYDFENVDDDPNDDEGHGTCCAGIVAGDGSAGMGTGVAPGARVMAIRVGGAERTFWRGLQFALERGADVISMSMTYKFPANPDYPGWRRVCESILDAGVLHANSIGNQGADLIRYPLPFNIGAPGNCPPPRLPGAPAGGLSSPISCGATDDADGLSSSSGRGPAAWEATPYVDYPYAGGTQAGLIKPDICAPGPGTTSCSHRYGVIAGVKPYVPFGGTSSATPHVAGCLALLAHACLKQGSPIVPARMQEAIEATAIRIVGQTSVKENHYGAGRIDVFAAYNFGRAQGWW